MGKTSRLFACLILTTVIGTTFAPYRASAVECANGGAGTNPAGDDNGSSSATACGENATAGLGGSAYGLNSAATGNNSNAFGLGSKASGQQSAAYGTSSNAAGADSAAFGTGSTSTGLYSSAFGTGSLASGEASVAVGKSSRASEQNAAAFGTGARATATDSVAIGFNSVADVANTVSVGSSTNQRRIVNLDEGVISASSTDAVNGSQLYATNQLVSSIASSSQFFQANSVGAASIASGTNALASGSDAVASGDSAIAFGNGAQATEARSIAMGANAQSTGTDAVAIGSNATAAHTNSAAFGNGATTTRANQQVFGTASNSYSMPGLTSSRSKSAQGAPTHIVTSNANGDLAAYTPSQLGIATQSEIDALGRRDKELTEGLAAVASMAQPIMLPGQTFAMRAGWGGFDDTSAVSFTAAGLVAKDLLRPGAGTLVADAGVGVGTGQGEVAGRAGLTLGW